MKYIIYEIVRPSHLAGLDDSGYNIRSVDRYVMERLDVHNVNEEHDTMENAIREINDKKENLKHLTLTVLPIFEVLWDGEIR